MISIVMACYKNFKTTKNAVISVLNYTDDIDFELILVNDGADRQLNKYFKTLMKYNKNIKLITNKQNVGWVKSINQGIAVSEGKYVMFLNNDIEVLPQYSNWLKEMMACMKDDVGAVAPVSNFVLGWQNIKYNGKFVNYTHYSKFLIGMCMLVKRKVIDEIGGLDERFGLGGNDDLDYSIRIRLAGYKLVITRKTFIQHKGFQSLGKIYKDYDEVEALTRPKLVLKWGAEMVNDLFSIDNNFIYKGLEA